MRDRIFSQRYRVYLLIDYYVGQYRFVGTSSILFDRLRGSRTIIDNVFRLFGTLDFLRSYYSIKFVDSRDRYGVDTGVSFRVVVDNTFSLPDALDLLFFCPFIEYQRKKKYVVKCTVSSIIYLTFR